MEAIFNDCVLLSFFIFVLSFVMSFWGGFKK